MASSQMAAADRRQGKWSTIGWQGISLQVPEDWFPAALGTERGAGYLRVQCPDGPSVEVKWASPKGSVDVEREVAKYRRTLERAARKRRQAVEWQEKPKVPVRVARADKNRRFFGWKGDSQALGVVWYCRGCGRVIIAQATFPASQDAELASTILSSIEDHGEDGRELWSLYGLGVRIPVGWALDKHQLMAGYTMLQFRRGDRVLRAERWALANVAMKNATLPEFLRGRSRKFWKDFRLADTGAEWRGHAGAAFSGPTRKVWLRAVALVRLLLRRPAAETMSVRAWHCDAENKIFAIHAVHPRGDTAELERALESLVCH
ncbi:MAG: hypothetical protein HY321_09775 [Armatimonadetes bacterium]|nr:hypothetical protein [Armatimonadota bacterium]